MPPRKKHPFQINVFTEETPIFQLVRAGIDERIFSVATMAAAQRVARRWRQNVVESGAKQGFKKYYMRSVSVQQLRADRVRVTASGKFVNFVEKGIKSFDMKPGLLRGVRARFNQMGEPYNIVAIRHGVPGSEKNPMSEQAYKEAKKITASERYLTTGMTQRQNVHGDWVQQRTYRPGAGRVRGVSNPMTVREGTWKRIKHRTGIHEGMVKAGAPGHSRYLTFRVVSMKSRTRSWWYPGVPPSPVYPKTNRDAPEIIRKTFAQSILKQLGAAATRGAAE